MSASAVASEASRPKLGQATRVGEEDNGRSQLDPTAQSTSFYRMALKDREFDFIQDNSEKGFKSKIVLR